MIASGLTDHEEAVSNYLDFSDNFGTKKIGFRNLGSGVPQNNKQHLRNRRDRNMDHTHVLDKGST